jgi:NAD(P) transhydrogenase subunit alpha
MNKELKNQKTERPDWQIRRVPMPLFIAALAMLLCAAPLLAQGRQDRADVGTTAASPQARESARQTLMVSVTIFTLAIFLGVELISKVPATLHTPLMSGSNAISGITVVGALIAAGTAGVMAPLLGCAAIILATINVVGGFLVTHRMLRMFKRR